MRLWISVHHLGFPQRILSHQYFDPEKFCENINGKTRALTEWLKILTIHDNVIGKSMGEKVSNLTG